MINLYQKVQRDPDGRAYFIVTDAHGVSKMPLPQGEEENDERRKAA